MNILFVCVGNINRSPAAEIIMRKYAPFGTNSRSAALSPKNKGQLMTRKMRTCLTERGYEFKPLRSIPMTPELVEWADMICYMDKANLKRIEREWAPGLHKARRLAPWGDIKDPHFARGISEHQRAVEEIELACRTLAKELE